MAAEQKSSNFISLVLMGTLFAGSWWLHRSQQPLLRNVYGSREDCECDYGQRCTVDGGDWFGPWYLSEPSQRARDSSDPGPGGTCPGVAHSSYPGGGTGGTHFGSGFGSGLGGGYGGGTRGIVDTQEGYRGGFGRTAHIGRAGG
jgi:hypothetical protein